MSAAAACRLLHLQQRAASTASFHISQGVLLVVFLDAVQEWVQRYKANRAAAAAELMTLLVKVST